MCNSALFLLYNKFSAEPDSVIYGYFTTFEICWYILGKTEDSLSFLKSEKSVVKAEEGNHKQFSNPWPI